MAHFLKYSPVILSSLLIFNIMLILSLLTYVHFNTHEQIFQDMKNYHPKFIFESATISSSHLFESIVQYLANETSV